MSYSIAAGPGAGTGRATGPEANWENGPGGRLRVTPGRVAALALGVPIALAMIGWTTFNFVALLGQANFPVNVTIPLHGNQLTAQIYSDLTLRQGPVDAARLTGTAHYSLFKPAVDVDQTATSTSVGYDCHVPVGNCGMDASLVVPQNAGVSVSTGGSDLTVPGFNGNATFDTQGGTFSAGGLTGEFQLTTGGGDLNANSLKETGGKTLQVNSEGGTVNADSVVATDSSFQSGGGDINVTFAQAPTSLTIHSYGGTVSLVLPRGGYIFNLTPDGGTLNAPSSSTGAQNKIVVDSGGGDLNITYAN